MESGSGGIEEIVRVRREKADKLAKLGWPSFPASTGSVQAVQDAHAAPAELTSDPSPSDPRYRLAGRLMAVRRMGKSMFCDLWDRTGKIQIQIRKDLVGDTVYTRCKLLDIGDHIVVEGPRFTTRRGELSIQVHEIELAAKSLHPLPDKHGGFTDIEQRYRQRYVDLIVNRDVRETFVKRSRLVSFLRRFLESRRFMEVETPMLQSLIGGAAARPFTTHHNALDVDLYLRIAPELYLKRLIVGGFERVYEIGRNFRNEGLSTQHNPEFTMLEFYQAYATYEELMALTEEMLREASEAITGDSKVKYGGWDGTPEVDLDFSQPFARIPVRAGLHDRRPDLDLDDRDQLEAAAEEAGLGLNTGLPAGKLVMELFEHYYEPQMIQPTFVVDFPAEVSPLSRRKDGQPGLTDRFELYVTGREIANGFTELNDPEDQRGRFRDQVEARRRGDDEAMDYDEDYCHALEIGMPPTAGEGIGIDRLTMLFSNAPSIRDVILFPLMRKG